ncbi:MAG: type II toxin-antitoxin system VapC family toxin [Lewinella sp.]|uniref:type II toxin-antitoxin system VapC family toxin n=1 Tax=Lewinella sp. TaxID=2004506 RepID=UPI003D6C1438
MDYLLDTNLIIIYSRESRIAKKIEDDYDLFDDKNSLAISVVTLGEIDAFIKKLGIGDKRKRRIEEVVSRLAKVSITTKEIIDRYGDIDAYSQGKLMQRKGNFSARNMGKNDIWIAATASVYDLTLLTTDKDFDHLKGEYLKLEYLDIEKYKD